VTVFPVERVRSQFPALSARSVFLDNPAGTQVPRQVIEAVSAAMVGAASNTGGYFQASLDADAIYARAHEAMAELLGGTSGREIVIGQSMTMLTFQIARSAAAGVLAMRSLLPAWITKVMCLRGCGWPKIVV
jgi:selenocysteine lyase/cysteine desulfurase